jgi:hypothetical protein
MPDKTCAAVACSAEWRAAKCPNITVKLSSLQSLQAAVDEWVTVDPLHGGIDSEHYPNTWDVSEVDNMEKLFKVSCAFDDPGCATPPFNDDIGCWDTSKVTDMYRLYEVTRENDSLDEIPPTFDHSISCWDTASVTDMRRMFYQARDFNQPLGAWDVSSVVSMETMFYNAPSFNQPVGTWDVSTLRDEECEFFGLAGVFRKASAFNQDLSGWLEHSPGPEPEAYLFADESGCPGCLPAGSASCTCGFRTEIGSIGRRRRLLRMRNLGTFLAEDEFANIETNIVADLDS